MESADKMSFAERVGRFVLFPLSWIDRSLTAKKMKARAEAEAEELRVRSEASAQQLGCVPKLLFT